MTALLARLQGRRQQPVGKPRPVLGCLQNKAPGGLVGQHVLGERRAENGQALHDGTEAIAVGTLEPGA